jgi:hypothetical protein
MAGLNIDSTPIIAAFARLEQMRELIDGRLAFSEAEAAALLGLNDWQLRGERRRRRIECCRVVGGKVRYTIPQILNYLNGTRPSDEKGRGHFGY